MLSREAEDLGAGYYTGGDVFAAHSPGAAQGTQAALDSSSAFIINYSGNPNDTRAVGAAFDNAARQVTGIFNEIQRPGRSVSQADYDRANQAYLELSSFATTHPVEYVQRQWGTDDYQPAYIRRLRQILAAIGVGTPAPDPTEGPVTPDPTGEGDAPAPGPTDIERLADLFESRFAPSLGGGTLTDAPPATVTTITPAGGASAGGHGLAAVVVLGIAAVVGYYIWQHYKKGGGSGE